MTPARVTLTMRRNNNPDVLRFNVSDNGAPVDCTPYVVYMHVRLRKAAPGDPLLLVSMTPTSAGSVFTTDASGFELTVYKADFANIPADLVEGKPFTGAYDIMMILPGVGQEVWFEGDFILNEGVTTYGG